MNARRWSASLLVLVLLLAAAAATPAGAEDGAERLGVDAQHWVFEFTTPPTLDRAFLTQARPVRSGSAIEVVLVTPTPEGEVTTGLELAASTTDTAFLAELASHLERFGVSRATRAPVSQVIRIAGERASLDGVLLDDGRLLAPSETSPALVTLAPPEAVPLAASCSGAFVPKQPYTAVWTLSDLQGRFIEMKFSWSTANRNNLAACGSATTYEHEFWEYNYDRKHYLGKMVTWSTNLPAAYRDTNFADSANELGYTIGVSQAISIQANKTYTVYITTTNGNARSGKAKVQGQRGHRFPTGCHSTWCIFADKTTSIIPAWQLVLPKKAPIAV